MAVPFRLDLHPTLTTFQAVVSGACLILPLQRPAFIMFRLHINASPYSHPNAPFMFSLTACSLDFCERDKVLVFDA